VADIAKRFVENPILSPANVAPSTVGLEAKCVFNPGAFRYRGRVGLLLRVAEFAPWDEKIARVPVLSSSGLRIREFDRHAPGFAFTHPARFMAEGWMWLTSLSHFRLAWSEDGIHFSAGERPTIYPRGALESFGIEDARVTEIDGEFLITFAQVSPSGVGAGMIATRDWESFDRRGMVLPSHNRECVVFTERIGGDYVCLHRPSGAGMGGHFLWLARSPDGIHWGRHACIAQPRPGKWDEGRIGACAAPVRTGDGWLTIYHGATRQGRYCLGGMLLDYEDPTHIIARSEEAIMEPLRDYEKKGFVNDCIYSNGHVINGDTLTVYYGAADRVTCGARFSVREILDSLKKV